MTNHGVISHRLGIKPYIVNTGLHEREVYACCPCGWTGDTYPVEQADRAKRDAMRHYRSCGTK